MKSRREWAQVFLLASLASTLLSCSRVETDPPGFPADPFQDRASYQQALDQVAPGEWEVEAFYRKEGRSGSWDHPGIVLALSKHRSKKEFCFLYYFPAGTKNASFSVRGAKGDPQPVVIDAQNPREFEWKTRKRLLGLFPQKWDDHTEDVGRRHPLYGAMEDVSVEGEFMGYEVNIRFLGEEEGWAFEVSE